MLPNDATAVLDRRTSVVFRGRAGSAAGIPTGQGIYRDWIEACRGNPSPIIASFNGRPLCELLMLGNIATRFAEETLTYNPAESNITNKAQANEHLVSRYREGWRL